MRKLWSDKTKFETWLKVELAVLDTLTIQGIIPRAAYEKIKENAKIDLLKIESHELVLRHDVIAFTTSIADQVGEVGRYFHYGLTSSDVVDTALAITLTRAARLLLKDLDRLIDTLKKMSLRYKELPCMGRTHGVHAEPTSFGLKFLGWYEEFCRHRKRLQSAKREISTGKLSGAVGVYGVLTPEIERASLASLALKPEPVSTQVIPRDRHAHFVSVIAGIGNSIERVCVELRHLQRTEVSEVEEDFGSLQKGSSAMPHKKNPISAENLTGCARLLRGYSLACSENVPLWHERDISHSSVERVALPDSTILCNYMLNRLVNLLDRLRVNEDSVSKNLKLSRRVYFSGHVLLALVGKGISREDAYRIVQRAAHAAVGQGRDYFELLWDDRQVREFFSQQELEGFFNVKNYLKNVDQIYERVFSNENLFGRRRRTDHG